MKKHLSTIIIIAMFIVGLSVLLYPAISNFINQKHASKAVSEYSEKAQNTGRSEIEAIFAAADDYNKRLAGDTSAFYAPEKIAGYDETLDITGTGIMAYIDIDRIGVELPVYHTVEDGVLSIGAGHLPGTSLPVGGEGTHSVLSGHRGLPSAKLFTDLDELEIGDEFYITVLDRKLTYRIDQIKTVEPTETDDLQLVKGKDYCTLMTCTPYGINSHRLLLRGVRVDTVDEKPGIFVRNEAFRIDPLIVTPIVAVPMLLAALVIVLILDKRARKKRAAAKAAEADKPSEAAESDKKDDSDNSDNNDNTDNNGENTEEKEEIGIEEAK